MKSARRQPGEGPKRSAMSQKAHSEGLKTVKDGQIQILKNRV